MALGVLSLSVIRMSPGMQLRLGGRPEWRRMLGDVDYFQQAMLRRTEDVVEVWWALERAKVAR